MADKTVLRGTTLGVTVDAKAHVDFMHRHDPIHRFDRSVALLTGDARPDMRLVHEFYEIREGIDPIPANLERRLMLIGPGLGDGLDTAEQAAAMTTDAARDRWHSRGRRT